MYPLKILLPIFILMLASCNNKQKENNVVKQEITFKKEGTLHILSTTKDTLTTLAIEIADNDYEIETGLMYRTSMKENRAMLFIFDEEKPRYFYMKNTQIPLDIIYINSKKEIVSFIENAKPLDETSLPSNFPAQYVLEINAGLVEKWQLAVGNTVDFTKN